MEPELTVVARMLSMSRSKVKVKVQGHLFSSAHTDPVLPVPRFLLRSLAIADNANLFSDFRILVLQPLSFRQPKLKVTVIRSRDNHTQMHRRLRLPERDFEL